ncbi:MAG: YggT family protein [Anaerolineales bacterium]|jgi:YggT family protein
MEIILYLISRFIQLVILVVIIQAVLTFFMSPFHPVRRFFDRIVEPMLTPIRRLIPPVGMFDFSPLILIIILQLLNMIIRNVFYRF